MYPVDDAQLVRPGRLPEGYGESVLGWIAADGAIGSWLGLPAVLVLAGAGGFLTGAATWLVVHRARTQISAAFESDPDTVTRPDQIA